MENKTMTNEEQELANELKVVLLDCQNLIDLILKNGLRLSFETGNRRFSVWREGTDEVFFDTIDDFLDNYFIDGKPFRELLGQVEAIE